jgi:type 1 fimbriae regulatory protein FimB/type 1 fimbriae regulatory protein FimE
MTRNGAALRLVADREPTAEMDSTPDWLTEVEVERLMKHARDHRDGLMILMAYRHGLRVSELVSLQWSQVDLNGGRLKVVRLKGSVDSVHPLSGREVRGLRRLRRELPVGARYVFVTRLGGPMTRDSFYKSLAKAGERAGIENVHPHRLRHGCGFRLVNENRMDSISLAAYLGHANVQNTARYARMSSTRFDGLWED